MLLSVCVLGLMSAVAISSFMPRFKHTSDPAQDKDMILPPAINQVSLKQNATKAQAPETIEVPAVVIAKPLPVPLKTINTNSNGSTNETVVVKLYSASVLVYYVSTIVLVTGATLQIFIILKYHRSKLSSYVMILYDSFVKLFFVLLYI